MRVSKIVAIVAACGVLGATFLTMAAAAPVAAARSTADSAAAAADPAADSATVQLENMTVTGAPPSRDLKAQPDLPSAALEIATSSIGYDQLRLQAPSTLAEAMRQLPGAHSEVRGRKIREFTSFRGQLYPYPSFALDGLWLGKFDEVTNWFPAAQIDTIEVVRSAGALRLGFSDLAGVVNVIPQRISERSTRLEAEFGSHGSINTALTHGDKLERGNYMIGVNHRQSQGPEGRNAGSNVQSLVARGSWFLMDNLRLDSVLFYLQGSRQWPLPNDPDPGYDARRATPEKYDPFEQYLLGMKALYTHNDTAATEVAAVFSQRTGDYHSPHAANPAHRRGTDRDYDYNLSVIHTRELNCTNIVRFGAIYNRWKTAKGSHFFWNAPSDLHSVAGIFTHELHFDRLILDWGLRYARTYNQTRSLRGFTAAAVIRAPAALENQWSEPQLTLTTGATYALNLSTRLYAHLAIATSSPDPDKFAYSGKIAGIVQPGRALDKSETRSIGDIGVKFERQGLGMLKLGGFAVYRQDATMFEREVRDSAPAPVGPWLAFYEYRDVLQYGIELESRSAPLAGIATVYFNATLMNSRRKSSGQSWDNVREIPDWVINGGVYAKYGRWDANVFARAVAGYANNRFNANATVMDLGRYEDVNLTVGRMFGPNDSTRVYASVKNALDSRYSSVDGWRSYGVEYAVGLQHEF